MPRRDVQHPARLLALGLQPSGEAHGHRGDEGQHGAGELHPNRVFGRQAAQALRPAAPHIGRRVFQHQPQHLRRGEEAFDRRQTHRRAAVEEGRRAWRQCPGAIIALVQQTVHHQRVAQGADAAFGRAAAFGQSRRAGAAFANGGEDIQPDAGDDRGRAQISLNGVDHWFRRHGVLHGLTSLVMAVG
jgi:hypothetical protein